MLSRVSHLEFRGFSNVALSKIRALVCKYKHMVRVDTRRPYLYQTEQVTKQHDIHM